MKGGCTTLRGLVRLTALACRSYHDGRARAGRGPMEDGFDVVPVRVEHVGRVIAGVIFPFPRRPVVAAAGGKGSLVEAADCFLVRCLKGDVKACSRLAVVAHEELVRGECPIALPREVSANPSQHRAVEALALLDIGDAYVDMVKEPTEVEFIHAARSFSRHSGSRARRRFTRSPIGGWVPNKAARPTDSNGLTAYSGAVVGLAWNVTSSCACSSRTSASANPCGDSQMRAACRSAAKIRL